MSENDFITDFGGKTLSDYYVSNIRKSSLSTKIDFIRRRCLAFPAILFCTPLVYWVVDACVGYFVFYDDSFLNLLIFHVPPPVFYNRVFITALIIISLFLSNRLSAIKTLEHVLKKSANWFSTTLKSVGTAVIATDRNGNVIFMNPLAEDLTGCKLARAVGNPIGYICNFIDVNSKKDSDQCTRLFQGRTDNSQIKLTDLKLQSADGREHYIIGDAATIKDDQNNNLGFVISFRDMSDLIEKHKAVNRLAKTIDQLQEAVLITNEIGTIEYVNTSFERITAFRKDTILNTSLETLGRDICYMSLIENLLQLIKTGKNETKSLVFTNKQGDQYNLRPIISKIHHPQTKQINYVAIYHDISKDIKLKQAEIINRDLEKKKEIAEMANEAKSKFLASISHELRTPLHGILSFAGFGINKQNTVGPEKILHYFKMIQQSGQTLLALINDLLDLSKLESGKMSFVFRSGNLERALDYVANEFTSILSEKNITVNIHRPDSSVDIVYDSEKIKQVVRNLLSNAIKFTPEGGILDLILHRNEEHIQVSVKDQGFGIPEGELESIFNKFVQSSKTGVKFGGTGLGLAICREIIDAHKGRIWAENNLDRGAKFTFEIPLHCEDIEICDVS